MKYVPEWKISHELVPYEEALAFMDQRVAAIYAGKAKECVWCLQHPPLYTAGTSANEQDLLTKDHFPVYHTGRGGQYTYHGPGQLVIYVMLDLKKRQMQDVRKFVTLLEQWIMDVSQVYGIKSFLREGRVGVWVSTPEGEAKIAALGVRIKKWVTLHGIAINIYPDLKHFSGIVPCGISDAGVTSFAKLGQDITMEQAIDAFKTHFDRYF